MPRLQLHIEVLEAVAAFTTITVHATMPSSSVGLQLTTSIEAYCVPSTAWLQPPQSSCLQPARRQCYAYIFSKHRVRHCAQHRDCYQRSDPESVPLCSPPPGGLSYNYPGVWPMLSSIPHQHHTCLWFILSIRKATSCCQVCLHILSQSRVSFRLQLTQHVTRTCGALPL